VAAVVAAAGTACGAAQHDTAQHSMAQNTQT
jgi:hypothetical protein